MDATDRALFLSLKPTYAHLLLSGEKTVELRRVRPRASAGTLAIVYASTPVRAVLGTCTVADIGEEHPDVIWELHGHLTGLRWREFNEYFLGQISAVAITVVAPYRLEEPVPLQTMRSGPSGFSPPQSFRYITGDQAEALVPSNWRRHVAQQGAMVDSRDRPIFAPA
jgi:predicted transcriptional regulator